MEANYVRRLIFASTHLIPRYRPEPSAPIARSSTIIKKNYCPISCNIFDIPLFAAVLVVSANRHVCSLIYVFCDCTMASRSCKKAPRKHLYRFLRYRCRRRGLNPPELSLRNARLSLVWYRLRRHITKSKKIYEIPIKQVNFFAVVSSITMVLQFVPYLLIRNGPSTLLDALLSLQSQFAWGSVFETFHDEFLTLRNGRFLCFHVFRNGNVDTDCILSIQRAFFGLEMFKFFIRRAALCGIYFWSRI